MSLDIFRLDGKVALITGGNRGIGLATAKLFGEAGAKCLLSARSETDESRALCEGENFAFVPGDITDPATPGKLVDATMEKFGRLDVLVNNAGVADGGDFHNFDDERLDRIMSTNLIAPFRVARACIRPMLDQGAGSIVNIGSISGYVANKPQLQVAYNSSKAAIHQMTAVMAFEYASRGIRVNALAPGYIRTRMAIDGMEDPAMSKVWQENTPMGRFGEPEEMASCALFLASDAASYVTGATLVADGGYITH
ncbi:SDR family NAD(P)-dependent oxidoreductase [Amaricoccus macauensis]|uniref:SDR family NAD(P)-dependent oxidoreductase n=1 Tax=Amaricoccus macauensis TaxID=57001 RepID=UPI003C7A1D84